MGFKFNGKAVAALRAVMPGKYRLRVIRAVEETSKSHNEMITITLAVLDADGNEGVTLKDWLVNSDAAAGKNAEFVQACGHQLDEDGSYDLDADQVIGWECEARLKVDIFNDKQTNKISTYIVPVPSF